MLVRGTVTNPKSSPLTGVQYVSVHCVLIHCFRLYHTEKDYKSEIIKIARTSVKPIQKDAQHVQKDAQHVQKDVSTWSKEATQLKWDNLTAWAYSMCTQVPETMIYHV